MAKEITTEEGISEVPFNPKKHLTILKSNKGDQEYLEVKWRLVWFHEQCPQGKITILHAHVDPNQEITKEVSVWNKEKKVTEKVQKTMKGFAWFHVRVEDGEGRVGEAIGSECALDFEDYPEKAQTKAMGRGLAEIGFGTQHAPEFNELPRIVDAPVAAATTPESLQNDPPPPPPVGTKKPETTGTERKEKAAPASIPAAKPQEAASATSEQCQAAEEALSAAGPYEQLAILSWSGIEEINPARWTASQCKAITKNVEKWFDHPEGHDGWTDKKILPEQQTEITGPLKAKFGSDAIRAQRDTHAEMKGTAISALTRGQADMLIEQLRDGELVNGEIVQKRETVTLTDKPAA